MTTLSEPGTFWATVAQVVPVLVLALTLEARLIAARSGERPKVERLDPFDPVDEARELLRPLGLGLWMILTLVSQLALFVVALTMVVALSTVASDAPGAHRFIPLMACAVVVLLNGMLLVAWVPVAPIGVALIRMAFPGVWLPGSRLTRRRTLVRAKLARARELMLRAKSELHDQLIWIADGVMVRAQALRERGVEDHEIEMGRRAPLTNEELVIRIAIDDKLVELDARLAEGRERLKESRRVIRDGEKTIPELEALYAGRTAGPELRRDEENHLRASLAAAAGLNATPSSRGPGRG